MPKNTTIQTLVDDDNKKRVYINKKRIIWIVAGVLLFLIFSGIIFISFISSNQSSINGSNNVNVQNTSATATNTEIPTTSLTTTEPITTVATSTIIPTTTIVPTTTVVPSTIANTPIVTTAIPKTSTTPQDPYAGWITYVDPIFNISMKLPPSWIVKVSNNSIDDTVSCMIANVFLKSPCQGETQAEHGFSVKLNSTSDDNYISLIGPTISDGVGCQDDMQSCTVIDRTVNISGTIHTIRLNRYLYNNKPIYMNDGYDSYILVTGNNSKYAKYLVKFNASGDANYETIIKMLGSIKRS